MHTFSYLFLFMLAIATGIQVYLTLRQRKHVAAHRSTVPAAFTEQIPLEAHQKAADYTLARSRLELFNDGYSTLLLVLWTLGGGLQLLDSLWRPMELGPIWTGIGFILSLLLITTLLDLPSSIYNTFVIEEKFGFNRSTPGLFVSDLLKQFALTLVLALPLLALILWLMAERSPYWWLMVWAVWMGFTLLMLWAYPAFIAPLFNKFKPLEDSSLVERITALLERCGFESKGIFVMDGSRRSSHGNAYFSGLGNNKRIVFFDTLLQSLSPQEIEAVLAHELGHFRRHHVKKRLLSMSIMSLVGLAVLGWLIEQPWFYQGLGMEQSSDYAALVLFMLSAPAFTFFVGPLMAWSSRKHEFEADDFAAQHAEAQDLIRALVKMYEENASTLTPDPLYSAWHHSHPPAPVRIAHLSATMGQTTTAESQA